MADILIVEDDAPIARLLADHLERGRHRVRIANAGDRGLAAFAERPADLVVLDVMLPGRSGYDVCREVRAASAAQPIVIMLTARTAEEDSILGYEVGADDYVRKPFGVRELMARIEAMLRLVSRSGPASADRRPIEHGVLCVDAAARRAAVAGRPLRLTPMEFDLLLHLMRHAGLTRSRDELLADVWGYTHVGYARTVDSHVTRLRRKLKEAGLDRDPVRTVHGVGYVFSAAREER